MFDPLLNDLEYISKAVGLPIEYTQGGGGNTSVKLDDQLMAVKASGCKLKQITPQEGYVVVNYKNIKSYYESVDITEDKDFEKDSSENVKQNIVEMEGLKKLRPSVEAGFHSILKKYVIHTHSVYANIICCTENAEQLLQKIFKGKNFEIIFIPYINPGFSLTLKMLETIKECEQKTGKFPKVVFMENHGLVVTEDDCKACVELHEEVNSTIREYLGITEAFPSMALEKLEEGVMLSKTDYISEYFKTHKPTKEFFDEMVLYPDQLVYLNSNLGDDKKISINPQNGQIVYCTGENEAQVIEETLLAYIYVIDMIKKKGLDIKTLTSKHVDFIKNWESEAYRKSLAKGQA